MIATLKIDSIAAGGDGVGRTDGLVVFVPRSAPGDVLKTEIDQRGRFARGIADDILVASADRVDPPCIHYVHDACGGCQLQHVSYQAQLGAKQRIVRDSLTRIGRREVALPFIRPSDEVWRYRSKLTLAMRRGPEHWIAGLHRFDDPSRIFAMEDCPITRREVVSVWREVMDAAELLPDVEELRGSVREAADGFSFTLEGGVRWPRSEQFFAAVKSIAALWWEPEGTESRLLHTRPGAARACDVASADDVRESGAAFAQVNPGLAAELHGHVVARALAIAPAHVIDAYAGAGATARAIAETGVRITAIELDVHAAAAGARRLEPPSRMLVGRVETHLVGALPADAVILNPPRAGLTEEVSAALEQTAVPPALLIYVSCNPATLARDLRRLGRYRIESLIAFDMFPQTAHVETVCELVPE